MAVQDRQGAAPSTGSVLLRHVAAQRARSAAQEGPKGAEPPAPGPRTPDRAIAGAIARAAERIHGLPLFFDRVTIGQAVVAEFGELLPEHALIAVVQGAADSLGAVAICPGLLTSLIEMQALGRISPRPAAPRRPTRTDAAICTDFVNACLAEIGAELVLHPGFDGMEGYCYASFLDDPRPLALMLEDVGYRLVTVALRAGSAGQRDGRMIFLMPAAAARPAAAITAPAGHDQAPPPAGEGMGLLAEAMQNVPIELSGILCRRQITLGELQALAPGDSIALPPGALDGATLETATGQTLFRGRLGVLAGRHALRISAHQAQSGDDKAADGPPGDPAVASGAAAAAAVPPAAQPRTGAWPNDEPGAPAPLPEPGAAFEEPARNPAAAVSGALGEAMAATPERPPVAMPGR
ncbi:FliM/FliN family flagellar motor C-terminal domain-containing protein [Paracoccus contaminans]|uniref:Flagellar motor switch protein FliN-like C-terminal domain-containing protein n=1 Tax=Paracoccus contaminans TaxID=1945662 RepID=A0A1W6CUY4_9RHOB|nr:FliM/FliN family flagellar motor C-terminal domain-containing protein [Paracoccus contaminans]ARJ68661.1 hypothetical protein B0A89_02410 [Paracoccus contaminans]